MSDPNVQCARVAIRDALGCTDDPEVRHYLDEALHLLDKIDEAERLFSSEQADWTDYLQN